MNRRTYLAAAGSIVTASISGCSGSSGDGSDGGTQQQSEPGGDGEAGSTETGSDETSDTSTPEVDETGPAQLELVSVTPTGSATFGEQFQLEMEVANTGGELLSREVEATLRFSGQAGVDEQDISLSVENLSSGEVATQTVGPLDAPASGAYRLVPGSGVDSVADRDQLNISVSPAQYSVGDTVELLDGLSFTVMNTTYEQALMIETLNELDNAARELITTGEDEIITVASIRVRNETGEGLAIDQNLIEVLRGAPVTDADPITYQDPALLGLQVNPTVEETTWLGVRSGVDDVGELAIGLAPVSESGRPDIVISIGESAPSIPQFEVADFSYLETQFSADITNTGDTVGTFRGTLDYQFTDEDDIPFTSRARAGVWYKWSPELVTTIPPGETRTVSVSGLDADDTAFKYRFNPFDVVFEP